MKAYFACSNPWNREDEVIYAQVKTYMDADVVRTFNINQPEHETLVAPLINKDCQEITIEVSVNVQTTHAIIETGSPV